MLTLLDTVVLATILYIIHRSFHEITGVGFFTSVAIAISANYYMVNYLNIHIVFAIIISIGIFPILEILIKKSIKGSFLESKSPIRAQESIEQSEPPKPQIEGDEIDAVDYAQQQGMI